MEHKNLEGNVLVNPQVPLAFFFYLILHLTYFDSIILYIPGCIISELECAWWGGSVGSG